MQSSTSLAVGEQEVLKSLAQQLATLTDQRKPRGLRYDLPSLLLLVVLAKLCGANNPIEIARWVQYRAGWVKEALGLRWQRMPHHSTYRRVLQAALDLPELEQCAGEYLKTCGSEPDAVFNLDGKSVRGTIPKGETSGLKLLAVQQAAHNAVVAQTALSPRENEISAARRLLKKMAIKGKIVTGDAIFAQRELSRQVVALRW